jgi:hypothetical protein
MLCRSEEEDLHDFVRTAWGREIVNAELRYADAFRSSPGKQFFEMMTLDPKGPFFFRVVDSETDTISVLLRPLADEAAFRAEHATFLAKQWNPGDLWCRCHKSLPGVAHLEVELNPGWRPLKAGEKDVALGTALGPLMGRVKEIVARLVLRAGLQWGSAAMDCREVPTSDGFMPVSDGQVRRAAVRCLGPAPVAAWD